MDSSQHAVALLERAIAEALAGNFVRAEGLCATAKGELKNLAKSANQGISPFGQDVKSVKPARVRDRAARNGRRASLRVPLGELLRARSADAALAGRWPPATD